MRTYRNISIDFWTDPKIDDDFTPHEKYLYLYFLTNPHTNICGCYQVAKNQITRETGLEWSDVAQCIARMQDVHGVIRYNPDTKEILVVNWSRYNWSRSPKVRDAVLSVAKHIRDPEYREIIRQMVETHWAETPEPAKEERTKEENRNQNTETRTQKPETDNSISNRKYRYPMDRVSETEPESSRVCVDQAEFETFWAAYPRAIRKEEAKVAFEAAAVPLETLLSAIEAQKKTDAWKRGVIPAPARWLKEHRWTDSVQTGQGSPVTDSGFQPGDAELKAIREMKAAKARRKGERS